MFKRNSKTLMKLYWLILVIWLASMEALATCSNTDVELQVLGSGGPEFDDGRVSSSYLIWHRGRARVLVDTGPGSSLAFGDAGARIEDLDAVLLTHLHVDHVGDLPAFVKGAFFSKRSRNLLIFGPTGNDLMPGTDAYLEQLFGRGGAYRYLSRYLDGEVRSAYKLEAKNIDISHKIIQTHTLDNKLTVSAIPVHHGPVAAIAWRVDIGNCSISFSGDMSNQYRTFEKLAKGSDVVVMHNAVPENAGEVAKNLHMLPSEIGDVAKRAEAKKVVLSHFMKRTIGREQETLQSIRRSYPGVIIFAEDGQKIPLY
jgi:ribonuclease BN (tRNA processing enzyme)